MHITIKQIPNIPNTNRMVLNSDTDRGDPILWVDATVWDDNEIWSNYNENV